MTTPEYDPELERRFSTAVRAVLGRKGALATLSTLEAKVWLSPGEGLKLVEALEQAAGMVAERARLAEIVGQYPEGSKLRELAEAGQVTPAAHRDPGAVDAMRAMVRQVAEERLPSPNAPATMGEQ